ncbi:MAG: agmatinase [Clostridiales bacterium]|jgi:agmatinase|nr:agmatinase [Clostridiales bacterium]
MWNKNIQTFLGCDAEYAESKIVLFGAPFDSTASYRPGARFAPKRIREESFGIETYSPYQDKDIEDTAVFDGGDLELPFGNPERALDMIEETAARILKDGKLPLMIGGEHLVTLGAFRAAAKAYKNDLYVLHFDAHTDLRADYLGESLSHATVMRRVFDIVGRGRIFQFGIRSGEKSEFEFAKANTVLNKYNLDGIENAVAALKGKNVYLSIDLDILDPSEFPATGTPEAGGIKFTELLSAIRLVSGLNIVACDISELCPVYDPSGISTALACKIVRELLLAL